MVLKHRSKHIVFSFLFERSVNSDGTQTNRCKRKSGTQFESSVNSDGTQTKATQRNSTKMFESSVNSDGTQTYNPA